MSVDATTPTRERTIEPTRLARGVHLEVEFQDIGHFLVTGGSRPHVVTWDHAHTTDECDCDDSRFSGHVCKHVCAVTLAALPSEVLAALRLLVRNPPT